MTRRFLTTMMAALATVFIPTGPSSAVEMCGFPVPSCVTVDFQDEGRFIEFDISCGRPLLFEVTVTDGEGSGLQALYDGYGRRIIGPPHNAAAYYSEVSCCVDSVVSISGPDSSDGVDPNPVRSVIDFTCD